MMLTGWVEPPVVVVAASCAAITGGAGAGAGAGGTGAVCAEGLCDADPAGGTSTGMLMPAAAAAWISGRI
jgi:hypothetical protein